MKTKDYKEATKQLNAFILESRRFRDPLFRQLDDINEAFDRVLGYIMVIQTIVDLLRSIK